MKKLILLFSLFSTFAVAQPSEYQGYQDKSDKNNWFAFCTPVADQDSNPQLTEQNTQCILSTPFVAVKKTNEICLTGNVSTPVKRFKDKPLSIELPRSENGQYSIKDNGKEMPLSYSKGANPTLYLSDSTTHSISYCIANSLEKPVNIPAWMLIKDYPAKNGFISFDSQSKNISTQLTSTLDVYKVVQDSSLVSIKTFLVLRNYQDRNNQMSINLQPLTKDNFEITDITISPNIPYQYDGTYLKLENFKGDIQIAINSRQTQSNDKVTLLYEKLDIIPNIKQNDYSYIFYSRNDAERITNPTGKVADFNNINLGQLDYLKNNPSYLLSKSNPLSLTTIKRTSDTITDLDINLQKSLWLGIEKSDIFYGENQYSINTSNMSTININENAEILSNFVVNGSYQQLFDKFFVYPGQTNIQINSIIPNESKINLSSLDTNINHINLKINLPPGNTILHAYSDKMQSNGLGVFASWSIYEFFITCILIVSFYKLFNLQVAMGATLVLIISKLSLGSISLQFWIIPLILFAIYKHLKDGKLKQWVFYLLGVILFFLVINVIQLSTQQFMKIIHPALYSNYTATPIYERATSQTMENMVAPAPIAPAMLSKAMEDSAGMGASSIASPPPIQQNQVIDSITKNAPVGGASMAWTFDVYHLSFNNVQPNDYLYIIIANRAGTTLLLILSIVLNLFLLTSILFGVYRVYKK